MKTLTITLGSCLRVIIPTAAFLVLLLLVRGPERAEAAPPASEPSSPFASSSNATSTWSAAAAWTDTPPANAPQSTNPIVEYFLDWFPRVTRIQSEQPHWVTPLVTVTPRLEEEYRYDQYWETLPKGRAIDNFGAGKGLELIPWENIEVILGVPAWIAHNGHRNPEASDGWADETFLIKYRLLSANEESGNYIVTAFMGFSAPTGDDEQQQRSWHLHAHDSGWQRLGPLRHSEYPRCFISLRRRGSLGDATGVEYHFSISRPQILVARVRGEPYLVAQR